MMLSICLAMLETEQDQQRFMRLFDAYEKKIYAVALLILEDQTQAEDAAQQTWLKLVQNWERISALPWKETGDIFIDPPRRIVMVRNQPVELRPREFALLLYFMRNPNIVLTSAQICYHAWKMTSGYDGGVSHQIYLLRKQIEPQPSNPSYIQTVHGFGYRFTPNFVETCDMCEENERELS